MNIFRLFSITLLLLTVFLFGFVLWSKIFGIPCWSFEGGAFNNTITREVIERCYS